MIENYFTNKDFCDIVRNNLWKIPHDIKGVITIPRGGLFPGVLIAEYMNIPITTIDLFVKGMFIENGRALNNVTNIEFGKYLVIDDSFCTGYAFKKAKETLKKMSNYDKYEFLYCSLIGNSSRMKDVGVDLVLENFYDSRIFEMNFLRNGCMLNNAIIDFDGFLCKDPQWGVDTNEELYLDFIKNAEPYFIPTTSVLGIVTSRIEKYRKETEEWLQKNNVDYGELRMIPCNSIQEKQAYYPSWEYKGIVYKNTEQSNLFIESNEFEARKIAEISQKLVYCVECNDFF